MNWLVRSKHNRNLAEQSPTTEEEEQVNKLWHKTEKSTALGQINFTYRRRGKAESREVIQTLYQSRQILPGKRGIEVTCIIAKEEEPVAGIKPIICRLITNGLISTKDEAIELINWYRARWEIDVFFHVVVPLKSYN
ncbi:hypothetical protein [Thorsellia anophelis]|uniref:Transposase DDE domain-containing protein n=1 Tax=Thorsellia anophelis DSM 18579 TaxID=1123402 RepID=A0A1I0G043_9GAMM|nr:hypothetical protein [Thorsellia anophelis]SET64178.1 hypothetical protein SAMN02583745_02951 [Thorsellia anophelis DSM 18579]